MVQYCRSQPKGRDLREAEKVLRLKRRGVILVTYDFGQSKVYYDCGQSPVTNLLHRNFVAKPGLKIEFAQAVKPEKYRLFQLADLVCTLKLIETRLCNNLPMTDSEYTLFGGPRKFKRSILKFIKQKEI